MTTNDGQSMRHEIAPADWHLKLSNAIRTAGDGDTIICHTESMRALAERARARMCPDKLLTFELQDPAV